jgi:hypothetical protein
VLPRSVAIERASEQQAHLESRTCIFIESDAIGRYVEHHDAIAPVNSAIVFLDEIDEYEARRAIDALCFATIAANEPPVAYTNGTTFFNLIQSLGGEPRFIADRRPRLHGAVHDGYGVDVAYNPRPRNAEKFHNFADRAFIQALVDGVEAEPSLAQALAIVRMAASDSAEIDLALALTLYAAATVRILAKAGLDDSFPRVLERAKMLLRPLIGDEATGDRFGYHIIRVWKSVRDDRNGWWHPSPRQGSEFPFEMQTAIKPHLIAFRMVQALLISRLVELGVYASDDAKLTVQAIESWIAEIDANDARDPNVAHSLHPHISRLKFVEASKNAVAKMRRSTAPRTGKAD